MRRRITSGWVGWCAVAALTLSACSSGDAEPRSVELDKPASAAPDAGAEPEGAQEPQEGELTRAGNAAQGKKQRAVAEAWFSYLEEVVRTMSVPDDSQLRLQQLAVGGGIDGPHQYAARLVERGVRLEGGMVATLQDVEVNGNRAVVEGCLHSSMREVDAQGEPLEELVPWFRATHSLVLAGGVWLVDHHHLERGPKCL